MTTIEYTSSISPDLMAELQAAAESAGAKVRDREAAKKAADEMDRVSQAIFLRNGCLDIAVPAIRELRDGV